MPELVLLSFDRAQFEALHRAAGKGNEDALREMEHLWDDYAGQELECFLCGAVTENPPFSMTMPERNADTRVTIAPLCTACHHLPRMVRLNRTMKLLQRMWSRRGKRVQFNFGTQRGRR
jgi:hypothetical protein